MPDLTALLNHFDPISLQEMEGVRLMERVDTKYVIPVEKLPGLLEQLCTDYRVLEIDGRRISGYETLYFDTDALSMYLHHHNGRQNRNKVRFRRYTDSGLTFFEVKLRNNKGQTVKKRIPCLKSAGTLDATTASFLRELSSFTAEQLSLSLRVLYSRTTLVSKTGCERVTIDTGLRFYHGDKMADFSSIAIAETKQTRDVASLFKTLMLKQRIFPGPVSKYCLGISTLYPHVKKNLFREKYMRIHKLNQTTYA